MKKTVCTLLAASALLGCAPEALPPETSARVELIYDSPTAIPSEPVEVLLSSDDTVALILLLDEGVWHDGMNDAQAVRRWRINDTEYLLSADMTVVNIPAENRRIELTREQSARLCELLDRYTASPATASEGEN